jgi:hypothetical protein
MSYCHVERANRVPYEFMLLHSKTIQLENDA